MKLRVAPASGNPRFWDLDSGWIYVGLFATDQEQAREHALQFAALALWEVRKVESVSEIGAGPQSDPIAEVLGIEAREMAFAWQADGLPVGIDPAGQPADLPEAETGPPP